MHGLWQAQTRRGAQAARAAARSLPDRGARHGRALGLAAQALEEALYLAPGRGEKPAPRHRACTPCLVLKSRIFGPSLPGRPSASCPTALISRLSTTCRARSVLEAEHPELKGKFVLLFFGRVHVEERSRLAGRSPGPDRSRTPRASPARCRQRRRRLGALPRSDGKLGSGGRMTYLGHVAGERARQVWGAADAFVLPSYSEGFSMAVLEALACRCRA